MSVDKKINYEMQGKEKPPKNYLGKQKATIRGRIGVFKL